MSDSRFSSARRLLAASSALLMIGAAAACGENAPSDGYWDLVVRELRPRTTGLDTSGGIERPTRGYPQTMSGFSLPPQVEIGENVWVTSRLTSAQLDEGAAIQRAAIDAGDSAAAWTVLDGVRSCFDSVGSGYGHRVLGYALVFDAAGNAVTIDLAVIEDGGFDSFDDQAGTALAADCRLLYAESYLAWINATFPMPPSDLDPCRGDTLPSAGSDDLITQMFDPDDTTLMVRCGTGDRSLLIAMR